MKKYWIVVLVILFFASMWFVKNHYDIESRHLRNYKKENHKLKLLAERREYQWKIATYESKMNIAVAKEVTPQVEIIRPADPNE